MKRNILKVSYLDFKANEIFLSKPDNLRITSLWTDTPLQRNLGRWKKDLCPKIDFTMNEVSTNELDAT